MTSILRESRPYLVEARSVLPRARLAQRAGALAVDLAVLLVGLLATLLLGLSIADPRIVGWLVATWALIVVPLYFALYHAFGGPERGPGWTPGQQEFGICVCDAGTFARIGPGRALLRSYGGLLAVALVVPAIVDLLSVFASPDRRAWHDRLSRSEVLRVAAVGWAPVVSPPTVAARGEVFEPGPASVSGLLARAQTLVRGNGRLLVGSTLAVYAGLVLVSTLLVPLLVFDLEGDLEAWAGLFYWLEVALLLFASGVYWTQAALVTAVEAIRVGEGGIGVAEVVRRASRRANALTFVIVCLGLLAVSVGFLVPLTLLLLARLAFVVPAIALEEAPALGAFRRSWLLTRGSTAFAFGLLLLSGLVLAMIVAVAACIGMVAADVVSPEAGVVEVALGIAAVLALATVPVSFVLAHVGCIWCLYYYDLRDRPDAGGERR